MKHYVLSLCAFFVVSLSIAQNIGSGRDIDKAMEYTRLQLQEQVARQMDKIDWNHIDKRTTTDSAIYTIPIVVHVVHNYGPELVSDDVVNKFIDTISDYFLKRNADTANIINKYKDRAVNTRIAFKLARRDPAGHPTRGIEAYLFIFDELPGRRG